MPIWAFLILSAILVLYLTVKPLLIRTDVQNYSMQALFQSIFYDPILNIFVALYNVLGDVGIAIVVLTVLIKLVLYPLTSKSIKAQKELQDLQPKLEALKAKHKDEQQVLAQKTMELYKEHKVNPFGSCLPILVQLPVFIALYYVLRSGLTDVSTLDQLYPFITNPGTIDPFSFGKFDLSQTSVFLAVLAAGTQFWQTKMLSRKRPPKKAGAGAKDESTMAQMNQNMLYIMPVVTLMIGLQFPAGLTLYWFLSTLISGLQQLYVFKKHHTKDEVIEGEIVE